MDRVAPKPWPCLTGKPLCKNITIIIFLYYLFTQVGPNAQTIYEMLLSGIPAVSSERGSGGERRQVKLDYTRLDGRLNQTALWQILWTRLLVGRPLSIKIKAFEL